MDNELLAKQNKMISNFSDPTFGRKKTSQHYNNSPSFLDQQNKLISRYKDPTASRPKTSMFYKDKPDLKPLKNRANKKN